MTQGVSLAEELARVLAGLVNLDVYHFTSFWDPSSAHDDVEDWRECAMCQDRRDEIVATPSKELTTMANAALVWLAEQIPHLDQDPDDPNDEDVTLVDDHIIGTRDACARIGGRCRLLPPCERGDYK